MEPGDTLFFVINAFTAAAKADNLTTADVYKYEKAGGQILSHGQSLKSPCPAIRSGGRAPPYHILNQGVFHDISYPVRLVRSHFERRALFRINSQTRR